MQRQEQRHSQKMPPIGEPVSRAARNCVLGFRRRRIQPENIAGKSA
jgi:hypothetical protein